MNRFPLTNMIDIDRASETHTQLRYREYIALLWKILTLRNYIKISHVGVLRMVHFITSRNLLYSKEEVKRITEKYNVCRRKAKNLSQSTLRKTE